MKPLPTVSIMRDGEIVRINRKKYNPDIHGSIVELDGTVNAPKIDAGVIVPQQIAALTAKTETAVTVTPGPISAPPAPPPAPVAAQPPAQPVTPPPAPEKPALAVVKKGRRFHVVDMTGQPAAQPGIDSAGYTTETAAWDAILKGGTNA